MIIPASCPPFAATFARSLANIQALVLDPVIPVPVRMFKAEMIVLAELF